MLKPRCEKDAIEGRAGFHSALHGWFSKHGRDYPWRRTTDPYQILVSEVMLQQTQIATVLGKGYFNRFIEAFPDVAALAAAEDAPLLKAWEGLGYYRRARMLRETARAVVHLHGGRFPEEIEDLGKLPGIGPYTAGALRAFAFGKPSVLVDGNVARVIARLMDFNEPIDATSGLRQIWSWAGELADPRKPRPYHAALMELGQRICRPGVPDCLGCPVSRFCRCSAPENLPLKGRKTAITEVDEHVLWLRDRKGRVLLHQEAGARRTGLWKLPVRKESELAGFAEILTQRYGITRFRVTMRVHDGGVAAPGFQPVDGDSWKTPEEIAALALAAPFRKAVERLLHEI